MNSVKATRVQIPEADPKVIRAIVAEVGVEVSQSPGHRYLDFSGRALPEERPWLVNLV